MLSFKSLRQTLLMGVATFGAAAAVGAIEQPAFAQEVTRTYNIQAQDLNSALREFALQTGRDVLYPPEIVAGKRSSGAQGQLTERQALETLLAGTGLRFEQTASNGYAVQDPNSPTQLGDADQTMPSEELVVIGTRIRGATPIASSPLVYSSEDLQNSGHSSVTDFLTSIPQNFGGNLTSVTTGEGNLARGTGINLRGLGLGTTLTLIDGRRQTTSGDNGNFIDVSAIPAAAIERIEILPDGASALYGSDAIGGVVNFILRRDFDGAEFGAQLGTADGFDEQRLSQVFGTTWTSGSFLVGYQYYHRDDLDASSRDYAASADKRPFGGSDFRSSFSNPGTIFLGPNTYAIPAGQDGTSLTPAQLIVGTRNRGNQNEGVTLLADTTTQAAFLSATLTPSNNTEIFADVRYGLRDFTGRGGPAIFPVSVPSTNPFYVHPTGGSSPVTVFYSFIDDLGNITGSGEAESWTADLGLRVGLDNNWDLTVFGAYGEGIEHTVTSNLLNIPALFAAIANTDPATALNVFADGSNTNPAALAGLNLRQVNHTESSIAQVNATADGDLFRLPSGIARLALGADYYNISLKSARSRIPANELQRDVLAAFGELSLPLLGPNSVEGSMPLLELSIAARYDEYSDFGSTFNPKVGVRISPADFLSLRASWGTSFRAPNLIDLDTRTVGSGDRIDFFPSPIPAGSETVLVRGGSNPGLLPEESTSLSIGGDISLRSGFGAHLTYYDIEYTDKIITPGGLDPLFILFNESAWAGFINRTPSPAELAALCAGLAAGNCAATPPTAIIDLRLANAARLSTSGLDLGLEQRLSSPLGDLHLGISANYVVAFEQQSASTSASADLLDTVGFPTHLRIRGVVDLANGPWGANAAINFTNAYTDNISVPQREIDSWTTVDLGLRYEFGDQSELLEGVRAALRATNVFNEAPPFFNTGLGYDPANATPLGRAISLELVKRW